MKTPSAVAWFMALFLCGCATESPHVEESRSAAAGVSRTAPPEPEIGSVAEDEVKNTAVLTAEKTPKPEKVSELPLKRLQLAAVSEYKLNYITDFSVLAWAAVPEGKFDVYGLNSAIHYEFLAVPDRELCKITSKNPAVKVSGAEAKFTLDFGNLAKNCKYIVFLGVEIEFSGCTTEKFMLYYNSNAQAKVFVNQALVLTLDNLVLPGGDDTVKSLPFELRNGNNLVVMKLLVDGPGGEEGKLLLRPVDVRSKFQLKPCE